MDIEEWDELPPEFADLGDDPIEATPEPDENEGDAHRDPAGSRDEAPSDET